MAGDDEHYKANAHSISPLHVGFSECYYAYIL